MADKTSRVATDVGGTFTDLVAFETDSQTEDTCAQARFAPPALSRAWVTSTSL